MDATEPGLFDLPAEGPATTPVRQQRGRKRERWARSVSAEVTIIDAEILCAAAVRARQDAVTVQFETAADGSDPTSVTHGDLANPPAWAGGDACDSLVWLLWPTAGLESALEADAFQVLSQGCQVAAESADRCTLIWTVSVRLKDADALRRLAAQAKPAEAAAIADSLATAWQHAADPYAPLRSIPGISWEPASVEVERLPARAARAG